MGLDMYLKARKFINNWDYRPEDKPINQAIREAVGLGHRNDEDADVYITIGVGYWRKANQIHKWFVDNVQDGEDDCGNYGVATEQLKELAETCRKVLNDKSLASELLPAQSGFFFGGTDYDEWYFKDLEYTATEIEKLLSIEKPEGRGYYPWSYVYHSSW